MTQFIWSVLFLCAAVACNWLVGIADKIAVQKFDWDWNAFIWGIVKIFTVLVALIGIGFIWEYSGIDLSAAGFEPITILNAGIVVYVVKAAKHVFEMIGIWKEGTK